MFRKATGSGGRVTLDEVVALTLRSEGDVRFENLGVRCSLEGSLELDLIADNGRKYHTLRSLSYLTGKYSTVSSRWHPEDVGISKGRTAYLGHP